MDMCLGRASLRRAVLWQEFTKSLENKSENRVCRLCCKWEPQPFAPAKGLRLAVFEAYERSLFPRRKSSNEQRWGCYGLCSEPGSRVLQSFCIKLGDPRCSAGPDGEIFTVADLATGSLDLHGWKVLLRDTKEVVGVVDEVIHIGSAESDEIFESVLKLIYTSGSQNENSDDSSSDIEDGEESDYLEFLVPLVEDIVRKVDVKNNCLFITPPEGLLELARIPQLLRDLEPKLLEFCQHQNDGIRDCLKSAKTSKNGRFSDDAIQLVAWRGRFIEERFEIFMPTRRQLIAARRHELVEDIMAAGGFLAVAQALKLPSRRRPNGFW